jgi:hypothetical protein
VIFLRGEGRARTAESRLGVAEASAGGKNSLVWD